MNWKVLIGVWLVTAAMYLPAVMTAPFVWEDFNATALESPTAPPVAAWRVRAVTRLSYRLDRWMAGNRAWATPYHLTNLALHLGNSGLVYALATQVLTPVGAGIALTVYAWHPLQSETILYIAARSELLATGLVLLTLLAVPIDRPLTRARTWGVLALMILAVSAKESAVVGFGLIGLWLSLHGQFPTRQWPVWRGWWRAAVAAALVVVAITLTTLRYEYLPIGHSNLGIWWYAAQQATALGYYLAMVVVPVGQSVDHDYEAIRRGVQLVALWLLGSGAGLAGLLWIGRKAFSHDIIPATFGALWVLTAVSIRFVLRVPEVLSEHQLSLAFVGISIFCGWWFTNGMTLGRVPASQGAT